MRLDRIRNEETWRRAGLEEALAEKVDRRVLRWFGHLERMDEGRWSRKVKEAKVEGRLERGRPMFGWLDVGEKGVSYQGGRLAGGNATRERK